MDRGIELWQWHLRQQSNSYGEWFRPPNYLELNQKNIYTFKSVFIGYGLKTGQGFYPGPNYL
jgi:hypothetical protein